MKNNKTFLRVLLIFLVLVIVILLILAKNENQVWFVLSLCIPGILAIGGLLWKISTLKLIQKNKF